MSLEIIETSASFRSLAEAKSWVDHHSSQASSQVPFLMLANEESSPGVAKTWRSYSVVELRTFLNDTERTEARLAEPGSTLLPPSVHELVPAGAPCKTYAEFDFKKFDELAKFGATDRDELVVMLNAMLERFLELLLTRLNDLMHERDSDAPTLTRAADVVLLTAHKSSKWSVHVIIDRAIDGESVAWASTVDCGNFVTDTIAELNEPLATEAFDRGVYSDNHTLRIYRAAKLGEPERILRDGAAPRDARYSEETMLRSLVSCLRVSRDRLDSQRVNDLYAQLEGASEFSLRPSLADRIVFLTSAFIAAFNPFPPEDDGGDVCWVPLTYGGVTNAMRLSAVVVARGRSRAAASSELVRAICAAPQFASYEPRGSFSVVSSTFATLACKNKYCALRGGEHGVSRTEGERAGASPVYLALDMLNHQWRQLCWSSKCDNSLAVWQPMDENLSALCAQYLLNEADTCRRARGAGRCLFRKPPALEV